jgi:hypothetical protein
MHQLFELCGAGPKTVNRPQTRTSRAETTKLNSQSTIDLTWPVIALMHALIVELPRDGTRAPGPYA